MKTKNIAKYFILLWVVCLNCVACTVDRKVIGEIDPKEGEKPKYLWFDAEANFERFAFKDSISYYLDKAKETGFTDVVVDVKPIYGKVLYKSNFIPELTEVDGYSRTLDWDYLQHFIDEAHARNLRVMVSTAVFPAGNPVDQTGWVYEDDRWDGKTALAYKRDGTFLDVKEDVNKVAAFLNPLDPDVHKYVFDMISEIVTNYDIDGYALDYCRYSDIETDFSELSRTAFEEYIGEKLDRYPEDILYYQDNELVYGKYAKKWFEFRAMVVHDYVKESKELIKSIKPEVNLEYWAASWHHGIYQNGQNWASKRYDPSAELNWASDSYKEAGFAEHLDAFQLGTYLEKIYGKNDPESIEYGIEKGKRLIDEDTKMYASIYALNHKENIEDAVYVCLRDSDGLMVFDIVQVIAFDQWSAIKRGIEKAAL